MKKDITNKKMYLTLREQVFYNLGIDEFMEVFKKYVKLSKQYKLLQVANFVENIHIPIIEFPFICFFCKLLDFLHWKFYDLIIFLINGKQFEEYGLTMFCGRQGDGKTISMVEYLDRMKNIYPDCKIVTNFGYIRQDMPFVSWRQFTEVRNGLDGVIFAIDELQNEYNSNTWKDFPEDLLSVVTQQRKQRIKIVATSQVFTRVVKQLREQCFEVVECKTFLGRWTRQRCYDADDYNIIIENPSTKVRFKTPKKYKRSFIQSNIIRNSFNSYAVIEQIKDKEFIERDKRGGAN